MSEVQAPVVEISLDGEAVSLKVTLGAATVISDHFGGFGRAFDRITQLDLMAFIKIIRWGSGVEGEAAKAQAGKVFSTGLASLSSPVAEYIGLLISGGRRAGDDKPGEA